MGLARSTVLSRVEESKEVVIRLSLVSPLPLLQTLISEPQVVPFQEARLSFILECSEYEMIGDDGIFVQHQQVGRISVRYVIN